MARDPYDLCPCGSGNKLKFCCADVATEMDKVERLLGNNQPHMAVQAMEKLRESHPDSQWVSVGLASTFINDERPADAKQVLKPLLKQHPEQPFANALYALASFNADGYPACKRAAHRAFKQSIMSFPHLVGTLAGAIAESLSGEGKVMAARQYMVVAMRLSHDDQRRVLFEELVELDSDKEYPYPLRGIRQPMDLEEEGAAMQPARLAARLATVGCFDEAADTLEKIAAGRADAARLAYNIGLFRAWDGDHPAAIAAFHQAAGLFESVEDAVECEVLAQCLEQSDPQHGTSMKLHRFELKSVAQLLSKLDEDERFARIDRPETAADEDAVGPAAGYVILDRALRGDEDYRDWTWETVPLIEGRVTIFDRDVQGEQPAQAFVAGLEGGELDRSIELFLAAAAELVTEAGSLETERLLSDITGRVPEFEISLRWSAYIPQEVPGEAARQLASGRWESVIEDIWPNQKLSALAGRSPVEAAGDPSLRIPLEAALLVFDAYSDSRSFLLPIEKLRDRLSLAPPAPLEVDEQTQVNSLSSVQVQRLSITALSMRQFEQLLKRAMLLRHNRLLYDVLQEALQRPDQISDPEARDNVLSSLTVICNGALRREEALEWIAKGREAASRCRKPFEALLEWKMRELAQRITDSDDPRVNDLLNDLWHNYGPKLPQLREHLVTLVESAGVKAPWDSAIVTPAGSVAGGAESWSPAQPQETGRKLWLPGD